MRRTKATEQETITFAPGERVTIRTEEWIVRSTKPTSLGGLAVEVVGISELVRGKEAIFLTTLDTIEPLRPEETTLVEDPSPRYRRSRLYLESLLRKTPPSDTALHVGHRAAMDLQEFQLVPAAKALQQLRPRILIADGVGLGKTLEVGILLSELIRRGRGDRILVVALKSILTQFQEEMWARFTIPLVRLDSQGIQRVRSKVPSNMNPFYYFNRAIISIDTLKRGGRYRQFLEDCRWDAIVVDECQHVAERIKSKRGRRSQRAELANLLARTCDSLILTSATPHDGTPESFASLMNLLEPTAVANPSDYTKDEVEGLYVRRFKKDVGEQVAKSFKDRDLDLEKLSASGAEEAAFEQLYRAEFQTIDQRRKSKGVLFRTTLLKAFLSSPWACAETIQNRLKHKALTEPKDPVAAKHDVKVLNGLLERVKAVKPQDFSKLQHLLETLGRLDVAKGDTRVVIFTERIKTLDTLHDVLLKELGLKKEQLAKFHGTLDDTKQQTLVKSFGTKDSPVRVLLASDAASEGVNLHFFCHNLIHFDVPWSLITMEQRNGRIDRYGQTHTPVIRYLLTVPKDPELKGDLRILERLIDREQAAHKNLGDVAWLLNLHEAELEEEHVAVGIQQHKPAEEVIPDDAPKPKAASGSLLARLMAPRKQEQRKDLVECREERGLFSSSLSYAKEAFEELAGTDRRLTPPEIREDQGTIRLIAPEDLQRRFEFLPPDLRDPNWEVRLSTDPQRVQESYAKARDTQKNWPEWQLFWDLHPVAEWLNDRVLSCFLRHEAPVLRLRQGLGPGEVVVICQGVISNQRSQPLIVSWFGVRFPGDPAGGSTISSWDELVEACGLGREVPNPCDLDPQAFQGYVEPAVAAAREHLGDLRGDRNQELASRVRSELRKLNAWKAKALAAVAEEVKAIEAKRKLRSHEQKRFEDRRHEIEDQVKKRNEWIDKGLRTVPTPYVRVAAVFVGWEAAQ